MEEINKLVGAIFQDMKKDEEKERRLKAWLSKQKDIPTITKLGGFGRRYDYGTIYDKKVILWDDYPHGEKRQIGINSHVDSFRNARILDENTLNLIRNEERRQKELWDEITKSKAKINTTIKRRWNSLDTITKRQFDEWLIKRKEVWEKFIKQ